MNVIWLVKCKWNVLSRRSGKIMEIMFKEKKKFFSIGVFFLFKTHLFPCSFYAQVFLYYFAVFLEQFYMFFSCDKNPVLFKSNLRLWFQKSKKNKQKKTNKNLSYLQNFFRSFFCLSESRKCDSCFSTSSIPDFVYKKQCNKSAQAKEKTGCLNGRKI